MASPRKLVTDRATQVDPSHAVAPPQTARQAGRTRVTPTVNHHQPPTLVDGSSDALELLRNENVRQGFAALDGLERLDQATARRFFKDRLETEARRAADTLPVLAKEPGATPQNYATMTSETNHTRIRRVLDFVDTDDRILEIGVGFGYITGMLMRETAAPDLVLLLEVLEHVPDAEGALATVARSVREDAAILFSVPTNGRIEHVWGHVSIFDGTRIRAMCAQAGLVVQHVETVQDQWVFVLATKSSSVPARLIELIHRSPAPESDRALAIPRFIGIPTTAVTLQRNRRAGKATLEHDRDGVAHLTVGSRRSLRRQAAAVRFPVPGDLRLRLELSFAEPSNVKNMEINFRGARGMRPVRWTWDCIRQPATSDRKTYVLRPGKRSGPFKPLGVTNAGDAVAAEIIVKTRPGRRVSLSLHRLAAAATEPRA
jgi:hypothetical protein